MTLLDQQNLEAKRARDIRLGRVVVKPVKRDLENHVALPVADPQPRSSISIVPIKDDSETVAALHKRISELQALNASLVVRLQFAEEVPQVKPHQVRNIVTKVSAYYDVPVIELLAKRRYRELTYPRHVIMWLAKRLTPHSYPQIGNVLNRDHTSVMHGVRKVNRDMKTNPTLVTEIAQLTDLIRAAP